MKNLFLYILFILITTVSFAQKFEIGFNVGGVNNEKMLLTHTSTGHFSEERLSAVIAPRVTLQAMYKVKKWQFGLIAGYQKMINTYDIYMQWGTQILLGRYEKVTDHIIPVQLVAGRKFVMRKFEAYCNVSAGYVFKANNSIPYDPYNYTGDMECRTPYSYDITAGCRLGATYFVTNKIGINAEIGADYIRAYLSTAYSQNNENYNFKILDFPATVGLRIKI